MRTWLALLLAALTGPAAASELKAPPRVQLPTSLTAAAASGVHAVRLAREYAAQLPAARAQIETLFSGLGEVTARAKTADSVAVKLATGKDVRDGVGTRLTLDDASAAGMEAFVERAIGALREGRLQALSLSNFRAKEGGLPYLDEQQHARLKEAAGAGNPEAWIRPNDHPSSLIPAGYTAVHMNVTFANGARGELQVRGRRVHELAELEHEAYNVRRGKLAAGEVAGLSSLEAAQREEHLAYLSALYRRARVMETAGARAAGPVPALPASLPAELALRP
jgi:hypothetical protein